MPADSPPARIEDTFDWMSPDYGAIYEARIKRLEAIRATPGMLEGLDEYYKLNPSDFINDFGMTADPRNAEIDLPVTVPFVLFKRQREFVDWVVARWKAREDGLCEKSRDVGASWLCVGIAVWMWRYHPGVVVGFGSRKEEYVDRLGDPKALFWKIRKFIELLPQEFQPLGWNERECAPFMRVLNPENGASIVGEAGDNIGRGSRTAIFFKDEAAHLEHPDLIDLALAQTSNCKIDVSSANGSGNAFYRKRHSGKVPVFTFSWRSDPRKDEAWYEDQKRKHDPVIVAQEIDIDYGASTADSWVPGALMDAAQRNGPAQVVAHGEWVVSVDAAHFGDDQSVIHSRRGRLNLPQLKYRKLDGPQLSGAVIEHCRTLERGGRVRAIVIELDGPGVSCYDTMRLNEVYGPRVIGLHTGARVEDGKNYNVRAQLWRTARDYLADAPVSMPPDSELKATLCAMKFKYKDGLLLMQLKKEYKKEFGRSPDEADAFILSHADTSKIKQKKEILLPAWKPLDPALGY